MEPVNNKVDNKKAATYERRARYVLLGGALLGLFIALVTATPTRQHRLSEAGAIAKVNDRHIDRTEFASAYQALLADKSKAPTAADKALVLSRLIEEELLVQRGREIGLLEGDAQVRKTVATAVIEFVLAQKNAAALNDEALRRYYNTHKARFTPSARLQIAQIFVPFGDTPQAPETIAQLDAIRTALRNGEDFATVAATYGTEVLPELPRIMLTPAKMVDYLGPDLTRAAARIPQGAISDALAGATGWHFLRVIRNQQARPPEFETVREQVIDAIRRERDDKTLREYLDWLHNRADIILAPDAPTKDARN